MVQKHRKSKDYELMFTFTNVGVNLEFEPEVFSDDQQKKISDFISVMSDHIWLDKSYVDCPENKHEDVFMTEYGWDELTTLLEDSKYGLDLDEEGKDELMQIYVVMIKSYLFSLIMKHFPDTAGHISLELDPDVKFKVEISKDYSNEWKNYPGKWQTWKTN